MRKYLRGVYYFAATLATYLGLSLLGWGLNAIPAFWAFALRLAYALTVIAFALVIGWQGSDHPEGVDGGRGQDDKRSGRQTVLGYVLVAILFVALFFLPFADRRGGAGPAVAAHSR